MRSPLISVITVVYNAYPTLEATIQSVINQSQELVEYLIIDGGSTDGSVEIIRKYESRLAAWCSEPDNGIYDAMNKGIDRARGDWLYFLGADDKLNEGVLELIIPYLKSTYKVVFGDVIFDNGHRMHSYLGQRTILQNTLHHQSAFYNKSNFENFRYDPSLKIASDYDLNMKIYTEKQPVLYIPVLVAYCYAGGASSLLTQSLQETNTVRKRYVKSNLKNLLLDFF